MSTTGHPRRPRRGTAVRVLLALPALLLGSLVAGCGETAPGEAVPALAQRLERVDEAVEAGNHGRVRKEVDALVAEAGRAQEAGAISSEQADRIATAADDLLARLPALPADPAADPSQSPTQPPATEPPDGNGPPEDRGNRGEGNQDDDDGDDGDDEKDEDKDEKDEKDKGKGKGD